MYFTQLNQLWYNHTMKHYLAKKKQTIDTHNNLDESPEKYAKQQKRIPKATY